MSRASDRTDPRAALVLLVSIATWQAPAFAQSARAEARTLHTFSQSFEELADRISPAVVQISVSSLERAGEGRVARAETEQGLGSGVIVDPDGYIITNAHVIGNARSMSVTLPLPSKEAAEYRSIVKPGGKRLRAQLVGIDRETDLAVVKVSEKDLPFLRFGESAALRKGTLVFAAGSPFGLENSVSMGIVSSVARQLQPDDPMIYIQTDASINPGNSGGPLVDADGQVVGINTFILSQSGGSEGLGFAIPSHIVRTIYEQIRQHGRVRRGQLGVIAQTITPALAAGLGLNQQNGVILSDVVPDGPAAVAGLEIKDILLSLDGFPLENARQFRVHIYPKAGQIAEVEVLRGSERLKKRIAVAERPQDPDRLISLINQDDNLVSALGVFVLNLDEKVTPLLPNLRKLNGAIVAGVVTSTVLLAGDAIYEVNNRKVANLSELKDAVKDLRRGQTVVLQVERLGQLQFLTIEVQ